MFEEIPNDSMSEYGSIFLEYGTQSTIFCLLNAKLFSLRIP